MNTKLTPIQKKEIKAFIREHKKLCKPFAVSIPVEVKTKLKWESGVTVSQISDFDLRISNKKLDSVNAVKQRNDAIKDFCKRTEAWGRKNFKNHLWLWENYLWDLGCQF